MSEEDYTAFQYRKKKSGEKNEEAELLQKLSDVVALYETHEEPYIRSDGDIIISLCSELKRNRRTHQSLADAVKLMMSQDKISNRR